MAELYQCKNCEKSFENTFDYCPYCGQETTNTLTIGVLFSNTIRNYFSVDARFFKSFIPLMIKPGVLARRFVDGKRLAYLHPAQFYLFVSIVFFFILSFKVRKVDNDLKVSQEGVFIEETSLDSTINKIDSTEVKSFDLVIPQRPETSDNAIEFRTSVLDSMIASGATKADKLKAIGKKEDTGIFMSIIYEQLLKLYEQKGKGIVTILYDTIPVAMFFLLPLFAFLLKLMFWKRGSYAHHVVFSLYFFTFLFISFCLLLLGNSLLDIPIWVNGLIFLSFIVYLILAMRNFYKSHWLSTILKANLIALMFMLIVLPLAMVVVFFITFLLY